MHTVSKPGFIFSDSCSLDCTLFYSSISNIWLLMEHHYFLFLFNSFHFNPVYSRAPQLKNCE